MKTRNPSGSRAGAVENRGVGRSTAWLSMLAATALLASGPASAREEPADDGRDLDMAGWQLIDIGGGRGEWVVRPPLDAHAPGEEGSAISLDGAAVLAIDMAGWELIEVGAGAGEWVVRCAPSASGGSEPSIGLGARDLVLEAAPSVVGAQGSVRFSATDSRVTSLRIRVFDVAGRLVFSSPERAGRSLEWDLRDDRGGRLSQGIYFFTASGRTSDGRLQSSKVGRLVIAGGSPTR